MGWGIDTDVSKSFEMGAQLYYVMVDSRPRRGDVGDRWLVLKEDKRAPVKEQREINLHCRKKRTHDFGRDGLDLRMMMLN